MSVCQGTSQAQKVFLPNMGRAEKLNWELEVFRLITVGSQYHLLASHLPRLGEWGLLVWLMIDLRPLYLLGDWSAVCPAAFCPLTLSLLLISIPQEYS